MRHATFLLALVILTALPPDAAAATWHVPGDAPTIQAGINLAQPGDDVLVAPGDYVEMNIVMRPGVWVHSVGGPDVTLVYARSMGRGFICTDLQQQATIEGFTILNGYVGQWGNGAGILCIRSNLLIRNCVIRDCLAAWGQGGGLYAEDSNVQIVGCKISGNRGGGGGGGGVACLRSNIEVHESIIAENGNVNDPSGGGFRSEDSSLQIVDSEIVGNRASGGGGVIFFRGTLTIRRCVIASNRATCGGGGISASGTFDIVDCLIVDNRELECGSGWALWLSGVGRISGCTVAGNRGYWGPPYVIVMSSVQIAIERTIVAFHAGGQAFMCGANVTATVRCSDIYGNWNNEICGTDLGGNFSTDPLFCDAPNGDYTLDANSPCLPGNHPQGIDCGLIGARWLGCGAPPPTGACCFADGSCVVTEPQGCEEQGGIYQGDGTACVPNPCPPTPATNTTWGRIKASYR